MRWVRAAILVASVACKTGISPVGSGLPATSDSDTEPLDTSVPTTPPTGPVVHGPEALALPASIRVENPRFATSDVCQDCHSNHSQATAMRDVQQNPVAPFDTWEATMMANASRDPIWRAVVSAEIAATPGAAQVIGERCMSCHAPMANRDASMTGTAPPDVDTLSEGTDSAALGLDGVSCTLCHQIDPSNFAGESSWKGNYLLHSDQTLYGPHANPDVALMAPSGWTPAQGNHMTDSRLCATCHTLITEALDPNGTPNGGMLVEQAPYLEMQNSASVTSSCQNCHLPPRADDESGILTRIARSPGGSDFSTLPQRSMARHTLVGGNTLGPQLFASFHDILNPQASVAAFEEKVDDARNQLQRAAFLYIENSRRTGSALTFDTRIEPRTGHKFPTGIPIRRAWLQVVVRDASGQLVFASGTHDARGRILDSAGQVQPFELPGGPIEPHHDAISDPDDVQIYEAVMQDQAGATTFLLLRGAGFEKDNRVLPTGWVANLPQFQRIEPQGVTGDADYNSGGDTVHWTVDVGNATGPFSIETRLNYQTLSNRYAQQLFEAETPETQGLRAMLDLVSTAPDVVALNTRSVP